VDTDIAYLHDLRIELERLATADTAAQQAGRRPSERRFGTPAGQRWRLAIAVCAMAVILPVAAFAAAPRASWLHGLFGSAEPITPSGALAPRTFGTITVNDGTLVRGGTPAQRKLLERVLEGIDSDLVPVVRIGGPPKDAGVSATQGSGNGAWLYFPFPARRGVASQLAWWETRLVAGAFRDQSASRGLPGVLGATQPYPRFGPSSESFFGPTNPRVFPGNAERLTSLLVRHIRQMGLTPVTVKFARPGGLAPIVIARTQDEHARLGSWKPHGWPLTDSHYEGLFFEVVNAQGTPVYFYAHTTRVEGGASSIGHGSIMPIKRP
jgi:hypothetical protein